MTAGASFVVGAEGSVTTPQAQDSSVQMRQRGAPVVESVWAPPGPIPNPVVTRHSAGEYYGGDAMGGEAAAGAPHHRIDTAGPR